jgi:hypothetical protein
LGLRAARNEQRGKCQDADPMQVFPLHVLPPLLPLTGILSLHDTGEQSIARNAPE